MPWVGVFYPPSLEQNKWLQHYSSVFDYVEVDSTFYSLPSVFTVKRWAANTPADFRFTAKMHRAITHAKALYNCDQQLKGFYSAVAPLKEKLLCILVQLPPSISFKTGFNTLKNFAGILDRQYRYAVEVRHPSWFNEEVYDFLKAEDICLVWNQLDDIKAPPVLTTDFIYLRLIGDRSIQEHEFGKIQKDRTAEMQVWADEVKKATMLGGRVLKIGIVAANNHYAGFGPATANTFRKMVGLPEREFASTERVQSKLTDFGL
jgi:uncharacterized protein YecE (DUF72 family)